MKMHCVLFWMSSGFACVEQWGRTNIFAQTSSSRLGENSKRSPRYLLEHSFRWEKLRFLATNHLAQERRPRLSESSRNLQGPSVAVLPKREPVAWARQFLSPKRGLLAWARTGAGTCCSMICFSFWLIDLLGILFKA